MATLPGCLIRRARTPAVLPLSSLCALLAAGLLFARGAEARDCELSSHINQRAREFKALGMECNTDKVTTHAYQNAYARFIPGDPHILQSPNMRVFEIGLGCGMGSVGASVMLWRKYFPNAQIGFAEYDRKCGDEWLQQYGAKYNIKLTYGDQANFTDLNRWAQEFPQADLIVDDGGHSVDQQIRSFQVLFDKMLKPAGVYVLEDVEMGLPHHSTHAFALDLAKKLVLKQADDSQIQSISFFPEAVVFVKASAAPV